MIEQGLTELDGNWREKIEEQQARLEKVRNELIEAEARLADRLAAINAFEFQLRARIGHLINRLEALTAEIKEYRRQLRWIDDDWGDMENGNPFWSMREVEDIYEGKGAAAGYRYMGSAPAAPPQELNLDEGQQIKQLYRQLARRFHPDMAQDAADRAYRTTMMIAINAAYAAGNLEKLKELALEPDAAGHMDYVQTDQQLAATLLRELVRCQRRLEEIRGELARLERHKSSRLMQRAQQAEAEGRDLLAEIANQIKEKIARKMVERDVLKGELENLATAEPDWQSDEFADAVWNLSLEQAYEEDPLNGVEEWIRARQRRERFIYDEDNPDEDA
jgi:hypothetical protein